MAERRAVVVGRGIHTPLGKGVEANMAAAYGGQLGFNDQKEWMLNQLNPEWLHEMHLTMEELGSGLDPKQRELLDKIKDYLPGYLKLRGRIAGRIEGYNPLEDQDFPVFADRILAKDVPREISPAALIALPAVAEAVIGSGIANDNLEPQGIDPSRYAIVIGSGIGGAALYPMGYLNMLRNIRPGSKELFRYQPENPVIVLADLLGAEGAHVLVPKACSSSNGAFATALRLIQNNEADTVLVGGVESLSAITVATFEATMASYQGDDVTKASLPFNPERAGAVVSEGAAFLLIQEEKTARKCGAKILAYLSGHGEAGGPGERTELSVKHLFAAAKLAHERAKPSKDDRYAYLAHATSTPRGDRGEIKVIQLLQDELGIDLQERVNAPKGRRAHSLGAANAEAAVEAIEILNTGYMPPATGSEEVDPGFEGFISDSKEKAKITANKVMSAGSGFGNQNGVIVFERYEAKKPTKRRTTKARKN